MYAYLFPFQYDINIILLPYKKISKNAKKNIYVEVLNTSMYNAVGTNFDSGCKGTGIVLYYKGQNNRVR